MFCKGRDMNKFVKELLLFLVLCLSFINIQAEEKEYRIYSFKKIGEIKEGFSTEESNYFWRIDDLCCDDENNLYVADTRWSKIFKFDSNGQFITSFGRKGQGPGEFGGRGLRISFGNDGYIYVFDRGNFRLFAFSKKGEFVKSFSLPQFLYDRAQVNSKGDIYLVSTDGEKVIDCYDKNFKRKNSFLDIERHFKYPFLKPNLKIRSLSAPKIVKPKKISRRIADH
jgi:sugar lactone lactonase YvrE